MGSNGAVVMGQAKLSLEAFIAWENGQHEKHEFVRGEVFATVGARRVHGQVCLNLAAALKAQLKGSPCAVFMESLKVQIGRDTLVYPDVFVTCDPSDLRTEQVFAAPTMVVEVLSPSTQAYDRGLKFTLYRSLPSLRE
jgi:Uma2 family endonuclease